MPAWRGREGFVVQKPDFLFRWLRSYGLALFGLAWIAAVIVYVFGFSDGNTLRARGLFFAGVGIAPLGLLLAYLRTNHQRKQLASEDYGRSVKMLGSSAVNVRQSGVYSLRNLVRGNNHLYKAILRVIASFARTQSMEIIRNGVPAKDESVSTEVDIIKRIRKIAEEESMLPDVEAAITMIKEIINEGNDKFEEIVENCGLGEYTIDLSSSILLNGALSRTSVKKANFSQSKIFGFDFRGTDFSGANLVAAHFEDCSFVECNFEKAEMREVRIVAPVSKENPFKDANFKDAEVYGADLELARGITQSQIADAIGDVNTKLPRGLEWPKCWKVIPESTA